MKKTIAILLVLIIAGVGLFAAAEDGTILTNTAIIRIETEATGRALFGVSSSALTTQFSDWSSFNNAVTDDLLVTALADIDDFLTPRGIGWLSGFNSTNTAFSLSATAAPLTDGTYTIPLTLYLGGVVTTTAKTVVPGVTGGIRGKLDSRQVQVKGNAAQIGLAPVGTYTSTITFEVVSN